MEGPFYFKNVDNNNICHAPNWFSDFFFTVPLGCVPNFLNSEINIGNGSIAVIACLENNNSLQIGGGYPNQSNFVVRENSSFCTTNCNNIIVCADGYFRLCSEAKLYMVSASMCVGGGGGFESFNSCIFLVDNSNIRVGGLFYIGLNTIYQAEGNNSCLDIENNGCLQNYGNITSCDPIIISIGGTLCNFANITTCCNGTFTNNSTFCNNCGCVCLFAPTVWGSSSVTVNDTNGYLSFCDTTCNVSNYGCFCNTGGSVINVYSSLTNYGTIYNCNNSAIYFYCNIAANYNTIFNDGSIAVYDQFNNYNQLTSWSAGGICINQTGSLTNYCNFLIYNLYNSGIATNQKTMSLEGQFNNSCCFVNISSLTIKPAATLCGATSNSVFNNTGIINNDGNISSNLNNCCIINNNGSVMFCNNSYYTSLPSSTFNNQGEFTFGDVYNTKFKGNIYPQVPSSAAFGTSILF